MIDNEQITNSNKTFFGRPSSAWQQITMCRHDRILHVCRGLIFSFCLLLFRALSDEKYGLEYVCGFKMRDMPFDIQCACVCWYMACTRAQFLYMLMHAHENPYTHAYIHRIAYAANIYTFTCMRTYTNLCVYHLLLCTHFMGTTLTIHIRMKHLCKLLQWI